MNIEPLFLAPIFYVYGSIPFALVFTYLIKGEVIYEKSTRNVGVANTFMVGGLLAGFLTVAGELSKTVFPLIVTSLFFGGDIVLSLVFVFSTIIGTNFSIFLKGRGGKGTTILIWTLAILSPYSLILVSVISVFAFIVTRYSYYTSIITYLLVPLTLFLVEQSIPFVAFGLSVAILFIFKYNRRRDDFENDNAKDRLRRLFWERRYVVDVVDAKKNSEVGVDASSLGYLKKKGFRVPATYVCTLRAYKDYISGNENVLENLRREIENLVDTEKYYSIKSTNLEDVADFSLAELFKSYSNVKGSEHIVKAIENLWRSVREDETSTYLKRNDKAIQDSKIAVKIQEMTEPELSGVVFTRNPINGMDEVVIESSSQLRETLTQDQIIPQRWVYKWGIWQEKAESTENIFPVINEVMTEARRIEEKYGKSVNLEWVYDGKHVYWLQLKELPQLKGINIYSNKLSKERMPGIIKPLIWSVNIPLVNGSWKRLFVELVGKDAQNIDVNKMAKSFYYRAYFNMGIIGDIFELLGMPRESIELLLGVEVVGSERPKLRPSAKIIKYVPRMILFTMSKLMFSKKLERFLITQRERCSILNSKNIEKLDEKETLQFIEELFEANQEASYFIIVTQLLMGFYNMMLKRQLDKIDVDIEKIDFSETSEKLRNIDPNYHMALLHKRYERLPSDIELEMHGRYYGPFGNSSEMEDFKKHFSAFLSRFGHFSDSGNDFSQAQWKENPQAILRIIVQPRKPNPMKNDKVKVDSLVMSPLKRIFLKTIYNKAARYREYSERMSFIYAYGYALFRSYFLHLARILIEKGFIAEENDIFYLTLDEIKLAIKSQNMPRELEDNLAKRKEEIIQYKDLVLPDLIYGDAPPVPLTKKDTFNKLKGVAASRGYYVGKIKVVRGIQDFNKVHDEDVMVIPYSDVSWNPLFVKAKAVISESGGILSHCSITAREYNIPAVVSVKDATGLRDGTRVAVNGYNGEILVIE